MDGIADVLASEAYAQADITQLVTENADMLQGMGACGIDDTEAAAVAERSQQALLELLLSVMMRWFTSMQLKSTFMMCLLIVALHSHLSDEFWHILTFFGVSRARPLLSQQHRGATL